ncbi:MAG: hypothetical protein JW966_07470 [Anaerolineae bacterium]|nr:hypothetical protein [Anaerolineae bacterium]
MSPLQAEEPARWVQHILDTIADNSALREGLNDDEALPLIDWGAAQAEQIGKRLAAPGAPPTDEEQVSNTAYALTRLMTRITWVVVYRHEKDANWLTRTFGKINALSQDVHGPDAPALSDDEIAAWIAEHANHNNGDLIQMLTARLTPPSESQPASPKPLSEPVFPISAPPSESQPDSPKPLSEPVFPISAPPTESQPDSPKPLSESVFPTDTPPSEGPSTGLTLPRRKHTPSTGEEETHE